MRCPRTVKRYVYPSGRDLQLPHRGRYRGTEHALLGRGHRHQRGLCRLLAWARAASANTLPAEVIDIFERHGFIWGGKWSHYDTMHFEYRPELLNTPPVTVQWATAPR